MKNKFLLVVFFIITFQIIYIILFDQSYYFDMLYYVATAQDIHDALQKSLNSFPQFLHFVKSFQTGARPSFYYIPGTILNLLFGFNPKLLVIGALIFFSIPLVYLTYRIKIREVKTPIFITCLLLMVSPLTLVYARYPMVELPLYMLTGTSVLLFIVSNYLKNRYSYLFFIFVVVGLLIKFSFIFFVILPAGVLIFADLIRNVIIYGWKEVWKNDAKLRLKQLIFFLFILLVGLAIFSGPFYFLRNLDRFFQAELAAYWSYPYVTFGDKLWWLLIAPTQITTVPVLFLFIAGICTRKREILVPFTFLFIPLIFFSFFMQSKGARMIAPVAYTICYIASYGFISIVKKFPGWMKKKQILLISFLVILNTFTSGFIPLDHAPAFEYPEGGSNELYKGLTINWVARGGWTDSNPWKEARKNISQSVTQANTGNNIKIVYLYYTVNLLPYLDLPNIASKQMIDELLYPEALRFPIDVFTQKDVFFIEKTGRFTHWGEKGSGLELERHLRFLKKEFDNSDSIWRLKTQLVDRISLPDGSWALIYRRYGDFSQEEIVKLYSSFLQYDYGNGINADLAYYLADYYDRNNNISKRNYWIQWIKNAQINKNVIRLVSKKDIDNLGSIKNKILLFK